MQARFNKRSVEVSLKTKLADKARSLSIALSDSLERYLDSLRLEQIHSRELGLSLINADLRSSGKKTLLSLDDALRCYQTLKGAGKGDLSNVIKELVKIQIAVTLSTLNREVLNRLK